MKRNSIYFLCVLLIAGVISSPLWVLKALPHGELYAKAFHLIHYTDMNQLVNEMEKGGVTQYTWHEGGNLEGRLVDSEDAMQVINTQSAFDIISAAQKLLISELWARKLDVGWIIAYGEVKKHNKNMIMSFVFGELPDPILECSLEYISKMPNGLDYIPNLHDGFCYERLSRGWYLRFTPRMY